MCMTYVGRKASVIVFFFAHFVNDLFQHLCFHKQIYLVVHICWVRPGKEILSLSKIKRVNLHWWEDFPTYYEQLPLSSSIIFTTSKWSAIQRNVHLPFYHLMKGWIWRGTCFRPQWVRLHRWSMQVKQLSSPPHIWNAFNMYPSHEIDNERLWQWEINQGRRVSSWTWGSGQLYLHKNDSNTFLSLYNSSQKFPTGQQCKSSAVTHNAFQSIHIVLLNAGWVVQHADHTSGTSSQCLRKGLAHIPLLITH